MIQYYFQQINHNRYLKMLYKTPYQISNIDRISMFIRFDTQTFSSNAFEGVFYSKRLNRFPH